MFSGIGRLNITSGTRTYRIPSPTRPLITRNAFQPSPPSEQREAPQTEISSLDNDPTNQKGFYISFDNEQPKRPKPPLRTKKSSPKKERNYTDAEEGGYEIQENLERYERKKQLERELEEERFRKEEEEKRKREITERERYREKRETSQEKQKVTAASAIIIGNDLSNPDPVSGFIFNVYLSVLIIVSSFFRILLMRGKERKRESCYYPYKEDRDKKKRKKGSSKKCKQDEKKKKRRKKKELEKRKNKLHVELPF